MSAQEIAPDFEDVEVYVNGGDELDDFTDPLRRGCERLVTIAMLKHLDSFPDVMEEVMDRYGDSFDEDTLLHDAFMAETIDFLDSGSRARLLEFCMEQFVD